ncbi:putative signal transducing protein [Tenacibaculum adriaticum]|uniref:Putative signal transducing protein n=1 Tax=Tenacibaculum adriaticum TaxID=413713 RepID=A0A5S5DPZ3_9FLAO|nr:DUF2007 domain-containing protein [Tenacibaculum adriaticum]TYP97967.1 putative signal transducing protein [Tenacibaculum adriaticum]
MKEHIKIYTGTSILANRLAFLLDEEDIPSIVKDDQESGRLAGFGTLGDSSELFIFNSDADKAKEVIKKFKKEISE